MVRVHLDTDIGGDMDDLCALAMLLKWPGVELTGVTTVAEEDGRRAGYVHHALRLAGRLDVPVAAGADVSSGRYRYRPGYPPEADYWGGPVAPLPGPVERALEVLAASIEAGALVVAVGQYTNLALLDERYPGLLAQARLFLMGGYVFPVPAGYPQWGNDTDYNIQLDPLAAHQVIEKHDCTLVPLTVTVQTAVRRAYLPRLRAAGPLGALIARQAEATARDDRNEERWGQTCARLPDDLINFQHDPLACAVALGWVGATVEEVPLSLELRDGLLHERVDPAGKPRRVVTAVDGEAFNELWCDLVCG